MGSRSANIENSIMDKLEARKRPGMNSITKVIADLLRRVPASVRADIDLHLREIEVLILTCFDLKDDQKATVHQLFGRLTGWIQKSINDPPRFEELNEAIHQLFEQRTSERAVEDDIDMVLSVHGQPQDSKKPPHQIKKKT